MIKRTLTALLACAMMLSGIAYADGNFNETGLPIVSQQIDVHVAVGRFSLDATKSYDEKHFVIDAQKQTNIHVIWDEIGDSQTERVNVMLAGGDLPDAFLGLMDDKLIAQNAQLFMPLNDLLPKYAPTVYQYYQDKVPYWQSFLTFPDGNIYGLMGSFLPAQPKKIQGLPYINAKWLERVGKKMPTTFDELHDVLVAFRDMDANGNGDPADELPIDFAQSHYASRFSNFAFMWGVPGDYDNWANMYYDIKDGKVLPTVNTPAYRTFLETMYQWGQEGLINLEGFSQTEEQYYANLDSDKVGLFFGYWPQTYIGKPEISSQFEYFAPVAAEDYQPRLAATLGTPNRTSFVLTASTLYAKELMRWWDFLSQDTGYKLFVAYGDEGIIFEKDSTDGKYYVYHPTADEMTAHGYSDFIDSIGTSKFYGSLGMINHHPVVEPLLEHEPSLRTIAEREIQPFLMDTMSKAVVPSEKREELDLATDGLYDMIQAFAASSSLQGVTDETWNAYTEQLTTYGYDTYLSWYQDYLDGKFVK